MIERCTQQDFHQIQREIADFWGSDRTLHLHHPMFLHEFGDTAFVIRDGERVLAYLFGLLAQTSPTAYVHLVAVRREHQGRGLARHLYQHFITLARQRGYTRLKAITTPTNHGSIAFHRSLGMRLIGQPNEDGIPVVSDYSAPGKAAVVFELDL